MLCSECNVREATVSVVRIVNGHKTELKLCGSCVERLEQGGFFSDASEPFFAPFGEYLYGFGAGDRACKICGTKLSEFNRTGFVGCEKCYVEFRPEIDGMIKKVQESGIHTGKVPATSRGAYTDMREYERLSAELKKAVNDERFEDAAKIKQKIKKIME